MEVKMQLKKYNHPVLFYGIAVFVPWFCWFLLAWLSHSKWRDNPNIIFGGSILGVIGLCGPFAIARILSKYLCRNRNNLFNKFYGKPHSIFNNRQLAIL
jgi:hypothetical protein